MNRLKKGPEIKLSELKVPEWLYDLYYDLKDRNLLPLVAILIVAMVAMPIILESSKHSDGEEPVRPPTTATASSAAGGDEAIVVSRSEPGLRDLRRRFKHAVALDPFAKKVVEAAAEAGGESTEADAASAEVSAPPVEVPAEATVIGGEASDPPPAEANFPVEIPTAPSAPESGGGSDPTRTRYASNAIDVRIVTVPSALTSNAGTKKATRPKPKAQVRRDLPELTMLPARATPAVAFMGVSRDSKKALLLVSSDVESTFGEANCVIGSQSCQLLALEPGLPETFVYGPHEHTYRIELLKITRTLGAKPRRAALGTTEHTKKGSTEESGQVTPTGPAGRGGEAEAPPAG
jgi:hypothetical protein